MENEDVISAARQQRVFRARNKLDQPGLYSHITQRAAGKEPLFLEDNDYLSMLGIFKKKAEKYRLNFIALSLMPNHTHILIKPSEKNLYPAMQDIFSNYASWFNRKYQRKGHLFGGPYRQAVCLDSAYLLAASIYIHLNPVRAGLTDRASDYRWSSCALYCRTDAPESFVDPVPILEMLDKDLNEARSQYRNLLRQGSQTSQGHVLEYSGAVERFCIKMAEIFPAIFKRLGRIKLIDSAENKHQAALPELDSMIQRFESMKSTRNPQTKKARRYIVEQLLARGFTRQQIASHLNIGRKTVYNILNSDS